MKGGNNDATDFERAAIIGFLVCGGLGFLVLTVAYSQSDNVDVANYTFLSPYV